MLSLAGRTTLIQTVTATIPNYAMQTMKFPAFTHGDIDKLNKNFLWGDTDNRKKVHFVK